MAANVSQLAICIFFIFQAPHALCRVHILPKGEPILKTEPFDFLHNLQGSQNGDTIEGLHQVKKYLKEFGYLNVIDAYRDVFDDALKFAIKTYQLNHNLDITGILDSNTVLKMITPRCGVPDIFNGTNTMHRVISPFNTSQYTFFANGKKWHKTLLTYTFRSGFPQNLVEPIRQAFEIWSNETSLYFFDFQDYLDGESWDLEIAYVAGDHGDGFPFDGPGGILSHAFPPTNGQMHLDGSENWVDGSHPLSIDIVTVALHEIGHLLGLGHTNIRDAIMYPSIRYGMVKRTLHQDDIDGIKALYG